MAAVRLADLLAGLSRLADLGFGLPVGTSLRSCALATRLARSMGLPEDEVHTAFYAALLHHAGCVAFASETARLFGDEMVANRAAGRTDAASPADALKTFIPELIRGRPFGEKARLVAVALTRGARWGDDFTTAACEVGAQAACRLGLPAEVQASLRHGYDLWRGGEDDRPHGGDLPPGARIVRVSGVAALLDSMVGSGEARAAVGRRAGGMLDPDFVDCFVDHASDWFEELDRSDVRSLVLGSEPKPHTMVPAVAPIAEVFADLADLKCPGRSGHSRSVAVLASGAADLLRLQEGVQADLEVAGLLHDLGSVAVPTAAWAKRGHLAADEWEQVRLHPYQSERILSGSTVLARIAPLVGRHHERLDGSGYHRGARADDLSLPARVLASAVAYQLETERSADRSTSSPEVARRRLQDEARRGRLDPDAVEAVLAAAGRGSSRPRRRAPSGLSERELEVLGLLAGGCTNAEIANRLVVSRRTAEHHVQHMYRKIGVSSRAAATMFAVEHGLLLGDG